MVCDPAVKEEADEQMNKSNSTSSIIQHSNVGNHSGGKRWNVDSLYESCRLKVVMQSTGQISLFIF